VFAVAFVNPLAAALTENVIFPDLLGNAIGYRKNVIKLFPAPGAIVDFIFVP
jgi:hypothetical protein